MDDIIKGMHFAAISEIDNDVEMFHVMGNLEQKAINGDCADANETADVSVVVTRKDD